MIGFCSMTESNIKIKFSSITKRNLNLKIYFLKDISYYFNNVFYSLDYHINTTFYTTVLGREK